VKNLPIYTTYLGLLTKLGGAERVGMNIGSCFIYYVARDRGNNVVAPVSQALIEATKRKDWTTYEKLYLQQLDYVANDWMERRAQEARVGNILLVCFEKDPQHCHRRLLAEEITRRFNVEYRGELSWECHYFRATVVNDICQKPKKDKICLECRFRPKEG